MTQERLFREKQIAIEAVKNATVLAKRMQGTLEALDILDKEDLSPVSITDYSVQALINLHIKKAFPNDLIMGEEDALCLRSPSCTEIRQKIVEQLQDVFPTIQTEQILDAIDLGGSQGGSEKRFWVLDPIDGTRGFIQNKEYAIALALIEKGKVVLGVIACPHYTQCEGGAIFFGIEGQGAFLIPHAHPETSVPIKINTTSSPKDALFCDREQNKELEGYKVVTKLGAVPKPFNLDSQCKYIEIATGKFSIYMRFPEKRKTIEKIWDHAAGKIIVEEAGGKVTDLDGKDLDFTRGQDLTLNRGILATNGLLHSIALKAIRGENT